MKLANSIKEVKSIAQNMLGSKLVTTQTGIAGQLVRKVYVEEGVDIDQEL